MKNLFLLAAIFIVHLSWSQIKSGPMLGYNTMKEVAVWVQMEQAGEIQMRYYPTENFEFQQVEKIVVYDDNWNVGHLIAKNLEPATEYTYIIEDDNGKELSRGEFKTQKLWQHREDPPNFSFALGSCAYSNQKEYDRPGEPYGQGNNIFYHIAETEASFMLWLGDNIYLREPDWDSKSGIYQRYTHFKSLPEIQNLWKSMHHYAIWDDHDFGPNDADRSFINKDITLAAFKHFWANHAYGIEGKGGITNQFSFNDLDFFLLDNRYFRSPNNRTTGERYILGEDQVQWLIDALVNSKASFKIVAIGGQLLSPAAVYENHATFNEERSKIIELIENEGIKNVIFINGDRHKTELTKMELKNGNVLYDYTCSPLTSKAYDTSDEGNNLRVEGTHVSTQNFGLINLEGSFKNRILTIKTLDSEGKVLWERKIAKQ